MKERSKQSEKLLNPGAGTHGRTLHVFKAMLSGKRRLLEGVQAVGYKSLYEAIQELPPI